MDKAVLGANILHVSFSITHFALPPGIFLFSFLNRGTPHFADSYISPPPYELYGNFGPAFDPLTRRGFRPVFLSRAVPPSVSCSSESLDAQGIHISTSLSSFPRETSSPWTVCALCALQLPFLNPVSRRAERLHPFPALPSHPFPSSRKARHVWS